MASLSQAYTIRFRNRSESQHDFLCYQQGIDVNRPGAYTLAWFVKTVANGVDVDFTWTIDYNFVWSEQGVLQPGIQYKANQVLPAGLVNLNMVDFTRVDTAFQFTNQNSNGAEGSLTIDSDNSFPKKLANFGIGMSGFGTFVIPAEPNIAAVFTPHPEYWVSFGSFVQGEVLDIQELVNPQEIQFPANCYGMTATLDAGNMWSVSQGLN